MELTQKTSVNLMHRFQRDRGVRLLERQIQIFIGVPHVKLKRKKRKKKQERKKKRKKENLKQADIWQFPLRRGPV